MLQILDTQLAVCRSGAGGDNVDEVVPKWDPSHLDLKHRSGFSMWVKHTDYSWCSLCVCVCDDDGEKMCVFRVGENTNTAGQVKLTIGYSTEENRLFITVHSCRYLAFVTSLKSNFCPRKEGTIIHLYLHRALAACSKDSADPYVSFILLPDKKATTKRRTATKKRDLNPEFNER